MRTILSCLRSIRSHLNMDVGFIAEFRDGRRYFRYVDSRLAHCPIHVGGSDPLEDSYCQRVIDGRLPAMIPDACQNEEALTLPATRALPVGAHISVPILLADGRTYETLCCFSYDTIPTVDEYGLALMRAYAYTVSRHLEHHSPAAADANADADATAPSSDQPLNQ